MLDLILFQEGTLELSPEQAQQAADILNNMIEYIKADGCGDSEVFEEMKQKVEAYIDALASAQF